MYNININQISIAYLLAEAYNSNKANLANSFPAITVALCTRIFFLYYSVVDENFLSSGHIKMCCVGLDFDSA